MGERVRLDYTSWNGCIFKECEIVAVVGDFDLINCEFHGCKLSLSGNASTIAKLMYVFYPDKIPITFKLGESPIDIKKEESKNQNEFDKRGEM